MEQMMVWAVLAVLLLVGFLAYPRQMLGLLGALARGLFGVVADGIALLFAWI